MLIVTTWLWGSKYSADDVAKLFAGVSRNLKQPHRLVCITDRNPREMQCEAWPIPEQDMHLTTVRGCFARLRLFDTSWQAVHGIGSNDRIACMDLDSVVTGDLDPVFDRYEPFVILQGANAVNPCPFNGSLMMLRAGAHSDVWDDFSLDAAKAVPYFEFPDDQGWIWHKIPDAAGWKCGAESGVYAFQKKGWATGVALPDGARLVAFPGWRDPSKFTHLDWVKEHWRA